MRGLDADINLVLIEHHRGDDQVAVRNSVSLKETGVYCNFTGDSIYARSPDLCGECVQCQQGVLRGENRRAQAIGFVVIKFGEFQRFLIDTSPTEGEVGTGNENKITIQVSKVVDLALTVNAGNLSGIHAERIERKAYGKELSGGPGKREPVWIELIESLSCFEVCDQQAPGRVSI